MLLNIMYAVLFLLTLHYLASNVGLRRVFLIIYIYYYLFLYIIIKDKLYITRHLDLKTIHKSQHNSSHILHELIIC
jgi:hypothetical protein